MEPSITPQNSIKWFPSIRMEILSLADVSFDLQNPIKDAFVSLTLLARSVRRLWRVPHSPHTACCHGNTEDRAGKFLKDRNGARKSLWQKKKVCECIMASLTIKRIIKRIFFLSSIILAIILRYTQRCNGWQSKSCVFAI